MISVFAAQPQSNVATHESDNSCQSNEVVSESLDRDDQRHATPSGASPVETGAESRQVNSRRPKSSCKTNCGVLISYRWCSGEDYGTVASLSLNHYHSCDESSYLTGVWITEAWVLSGCVMAANTA